MIIRFPLGLLAALALAGATRAASLSPDPAAVTPSPTPAATATAPAPREPLLGLPGTPAATAEPGKIDLDADSMELDLAARTSTFIGNVRVQEPRMTLTADKMTVYFNKQDKPERIECLGHVLIEQPGEKRQAAKAGRAEYFVADGKIVLTEDPEVLIGTSSLKNMTRIIYYRETGKIITEGRSTINLETQGGAPLPGLAPTEKKP